MVKPWRCITNTCGATLGTIGRDADGNDVLNLTSPVILVEIDFRRCHTDVRCRCGRVKRWYGGRVRSPG